MKTIHANPSDIQALLFDNRLFTGPEVLRWLHRHGFGEGYEGGRVSIAEPGPDYWHVRLRSPSRFKRIRTLRFRKGILARVGFH